MRREFENYILRNERFCRLQSLLSLESNITPLVRGAVWDGETRGQSMLIVNLLFLSEAYVPVLKQSNWKL